MVPSLDIELMWDQRCRQASSNTMHTDALHPPCLHPSKLENTQPFLKYDSSVQALLSQGPLGSIADSGQQMLSHVLMHFALTAIPSRRI